MLISSILRASIIEFLSPDSDLFPVSCNLNVAVPAFSISNPLPAAKAGLAVPIPTAPPLLALNTT